MGNNYCRSRPIAAPHATPQYERDQRERIPAHPTLATAQQSSSWQEARIVDAYRSQAGRDPVRELL